MKFLAVVMGFMFAMYYGILWFVGTFVIDRGIY